MLINLFAKLYYFNQFWVSKLPLSWQVKLASYARINFMRQFNLLSVNNKFIPDGKWQKTLWGIKFRSPIFNSAGMFKNGEGYDIIAAFGAGAYIGGTSTANSRLGNKKLGIKHPFISLHKSQLAVNFLGLPNLGDELLSVKQITNNKVEGCPIGWSLMRSPDYSEAEGLEKLIDSLWLYHNNLQIDFIEINESCPNIKLSAGNIVNRLAIISKQFLLKRQRHLPVIVKISNDISEDTLIEILQALIRFKFDGINLGNTSTNYVEAAQYIKALDRKLYEYFTNSFGGGISGKFLKLKSLELCKLAVNYIKVNTPSHEFHVIRSGGVDSVEDILQAEKYGIALNQWYTGFFNNYLKFGNKVYKNLLEGK